MKPLTVVFNSLKKGTCSKPCMKLSTEQEPLENRVTHLRANDRYEVPRKHGDTHDLVGHGSERVGGGGGIEECHIIAM